MAFLLEKEVASMEQSAAESSHSPAASLLLEPSLNTCYYVQRADETWHVAEVIQRREVEVENEKKKEFYVHYKDCKTHSTFPDPYILLS